VRLNIGRESASFFLVVLELLYGDDRAGRFADDAVSVRAQAAEGTVRMSTSGHHPVGFESFGGGADGGGHVPGLDPDVGFGVELLLERVDFFARFGDQVFAPGRVKVDAIEVDRRGWDGVHDRKLGAEFGGELRGPREHGAAFRSEIDRAEYSAEGGRFEGGRMFEMRPGEDGAVDIVEDFGGHGTEEKAAEGAVAVSRHDDEAALLAAGVLGDDTGGIAFANDAAAGNACEFLWEEVLQFGLDLREFGGDVEHRRRGVSFRRGECGPWLHKDLEQIEFAVEAAGKSGGVADGVLASGGEDNRRENSGEHNGLSSFPKIGAGGYGACAAPGLSAFILGRWEADYKVRIAGGTEVPRRLKPALQLRGGGLAGGRDALLRCFAQLLEKNQLARLHLDGEAVTVLRLSGGEQVGDGVYDAAFDGALQMTRSVPLVSAFPQEEFAGARVHGEGHRTGAGGADDTRLHFREFEIEDAIEFAGAERVEDHGTIDAVDELGREAAAGGVDSGVRHFVGKVRVGASSRDAGCESEIRAYDRRHFGGAEIARHKDDAAREVDLAIVAERERGLIEDTEQEVPHGVAGLFDFVEEDEAQLDGVGMELIEDVLAEERMRLAVSEVSGRRADEFGDFVTVLELGAIDFDDGFGVADEAFGESFDGAGLAGPGGPKEEEAPDGASGAAHPGAVSLIKIDDLPDCFLLADDAPAQVGFERFRVPAHSGWIQQHLESRHFLFPPLPWTQIGEARMSGFVNAECFVCKDL